MSDKIEPALTPDEWREIRKAATEAGTDSLSLIYDDAIGPTDATRAYCIAINNFALPDSDPRRITREWVNGLRARAANSRDSYRHGQDLMNTRIMEDARRAYELFDAIADALESYLPPEP